MTTKAIDPQTYFPYKKDSLHADRASLETIAKEFGTPLYVYSERGFLDPYRLLEKTLAPLSKKSKPPLICFAVKSNSNLSILRLLGEAGSGMDIVSGGELKRALSAGIDPEKIVFSGVGKTQDEIKEALVCASRGIRSFHVESEEEWRQINEVARHLQKRARVSFRYNPDVDAKTHPYISTGLKQNKFGLTESEVLSAIKRRHLYPSTEVQGLSIHIGSQMASLAPLKQSFSKLKHLALHVQSLMKDERLHHLDLGGGVGINYGQERTPGVDAYAKLVVEQFSTAAWQRAWDQNPPELLLEPGRLLSGQAGALVTRVILTKLRGRRRFIVVDAGMNDLLRPALYGAHHEIVTLRKPRPRTRRLSSDVVGPVCESSDVFAKGVALPEETKSGDFLALLSAGAYGFSMSSQYNSRVRPAEVLVRVSGAVELIRAREEFHDLIRGEHVK